MEKGVSRQTEALSDNFFEDSALKPRSSFDFALWFYRILKYWYLFVISLALFGGYAYLKNQSWVPIYRSSAVLMMEARGSTLGAGSVTFGSLVVNSINQQMILNSHDLVVKTVDKLLPTMRVDYFQKTKFKTINLYGKTPITIEAKYIAPSAYNIVFQIEPINQDKCRIFYEGTENTPPFSMEVSYGEYVQEHRFFIKIDKTERYHDNFEAFNFRFVTKGELVGRYSGRLQIFNKQEGSSALNVFIQGNSPIQDVEFLRTILKEFETYNLDLKNEAADRTIKFIDIQMGIIQDSLRTSESVFKSFQDETGIYRIESTNSREQLNQEVLKLAEVKAREDMILHLTEDINNSIIEREELADPSLLGFDDSRLSAGVMEYNKLIEKMNSMGEGHPMYDRTQQTLLNTQIKILQDLRTVQDRTQEQKENINKRIADIESKIATLPAQEREFTRYEKRFQVNDNYYSYLRNRRYEATLQKAANVPDNFVMEEPRQQGGPINGDEKSKNYMFFCLLGLALPLIFIYCKEELFNYAISTKEDCEKLSGLPVIGTIENISKKISTTSATLVKNLPKSSFAESFRNMRIRIEYMAQRESNIAMLVTSTEPGDGKTFIACNIASVYQLTGKKVVLIDFDLRRPSVSKLLNITHKKGVSNFLIGQVSLDDIILTHPEYEFDVIPAGTLPPNPSELIKTKKTKDFIDYLHTRYDYVIIDCSPIGLVSDAYILSKYVDTTLYVVRRAKTNKAFFKSVVNQVKDDGVQHLALVFNDVKGREGYYGTSRYYGNKTYYLKQNSYYHDDYFEK